MPDAELDIAAPGVAAQLAKNWGALSRLYLSHAPVFSGETTGDDWRPAALACLARGHYAQESLFALESRRLDAAVMSRVAFEHIVTFAWLLIAPEAHHQMLMKSDLDHLSNMLNDMEKQSGEPAALSRLGLVEIAAVAGAQRIPNFDVCAAAADTHWSKVVPSHRWDFRSAYANLYRPFSSYVHPRFSGFSVFLGTGPAGVEVKSDPDESRLPPYLLGGSTVLLADALTINAAVFGWPDPEAIQTAATEGLVLREVEGA